MVIFLVALSLNFLSTSACVSFFVFVSEQTHVGLNLLYGHHTLSHPNKYYHSTLLKIFTIMCSGFVSYAGLYHRKKKTNAV